MRGFLPCRRPMADHPPSQTEIENRPACVKEPEGQEKTTPENITVPVLPRFCPRARRPGKNHTGKYNRPGFARFCPGKYNRPGFAPVLPRFCRPGFAPVLPGFAPAGKYNRPGFAPVLPCDVNSRRLTGKLGTRPIFEADRVRSPGQQPHAKYKTRARP